MSFFTAPRLLTALALAALVAPAAANAASPSDMPAVTVSTAGLALASPASQSALRYRIAVAAHKVCDQATGGDALTSPSYTECFSQATADAKAQMQSQIATLSTQAMVASIALK